MRSAVIVAAGKGSRFCGDKIFRDLCGVPVVVRAALPFLKLCEEVVVVVDASRLEQAKELFAFAPAVKTVSGGQSRRQSVENGLRALSATNGVVAIHDGARPFLSDRLAEKCMSEAEKAGSAVPVLPSTDSVYCDGNPARREKIFLAQTPQTFDLQKIRKAYLDADADATDDGAVFSGSFGELNFVEGESSNKKITFSHDLPDIRVGCGFDLHTLKRGRKLILGGTEIPFEMGLEGHSDADVLLHAITDATLCAAGEKDIGCLFPDTDVACKDADSRLFLNEAAKRARQKGFEILFCGAVVISQKPKLTPYIPDIRASVAQILNINAELVNVSAKTAEKQGTIGEGKAIACEATVTLMKMG